MPGGETNNPPVTDEKLSTEDIKIRRQALAEQKRKTEELKMVLAVVGTMKAGKSTTINAIVGREILPNRNRPMTALPTLIEHKPGQKTPVLYFEKRQPVQELAKRLRKKTVHLAQEKRQALEKEQLLETLKNLPKDGNIASSHKGEEDIYQFLAWLNDMVRLAKALGDQFPFDQYEGMNDFPRIEVEFFHLASMPESGPGKLLILDTPGFNEAGQQEHLLPVMKKQLENATAVLAVLDYTQLKSKSESELRDQLNAIAEQSKGRMYALVNKFDQKKSSGDDEKTTREYVAHDLLNNTVPESCIFPVSSHLAYLSQRAQVALSEGGIQWQEGQPESWIDDFGNEAFSKKWKKLISDPEEVLEGALEIWEDSLFHQPLENAIQYVYRTAAYQVMDAAAAELMKNSPDLEREIGGRLQAQQAEPEKLRKMIEEVQEKLQRLGDLWKKNEAEITQQLEDVRETMETGLQAAEKKANEEASFLLKQNQISPRDHFKPEIIEIIERQEWFKKEVEKPYASRELVLRDIDSWMEDLPNSFIFYSVLLNELRKREFWPSKKHMEYIFTGKGEFEDEEKTGSLNPLKKSSWRIKLLSDIKTRRIKEKLNKRHGWEEDGMWFESDEEAIDTIKAIFGMIAELMSEVSEDITNTATEKIQSLESGMADVQKEVRNYISSFEEHAREAKLDAIVFQPPEPISLKKLEEYLPSDTQNFIKTKVADEKKYEEQEGFWGSFKRAIDVFGGRWGFDEKTVQKKYFQLNENEMINFWKEQIRKSMESIREQVEKDFMQPVQDSSHKFFKNVRSSFSHVYQILENGLNDQKREKAEAEKLRDELQQLKSRTEEIRQGAQETKKWANEHMKKSAV